ncbi:MAG: hypothetical protein GY804_01850 [Alphaproteobacteria bacterium]|nr:hypothetical protein [Alphaproteobacteria bacterium]
MDNFKVAHPKMAEGFPKDVKDIAPKQITQIYRDDYYYDKRLDEIDDEHTARHMFDTYVNHSPKPPSEWLQKAMNEHAGTKLKIDGVVGSKTIKALNKATKDPAKRKAINNSIAEQRIEYYKTLPDAHIYKGWIPRAK